MTSSKDKIKLVTDAGLPVGVAQIMHADGTYTFGFDPGFKVPKAKSLLKKKLYADLYNKSAAKFDTALMPDSWTMGPTTGRGTKVFDWQQQITTWTGVDLKWKPLALKSGRGFGKNATMMDFWNKLNGFNDTIEGLSFATREAKTGLEQLQDANAAWEKKLQAMKEEARLAITDEKVYTFMDQNYLPYNYARKLLEEAYIDALQNEGKTNDTAESAA